MQMQPGSGNMIVVFLVMASLVTSGGLGIYFWMNSQSLQEDNNALRLEVSQRTEQEATEGSLRLQPPQPQAATVTLSQEIITGQVLQSEAVEDIVVECFVLPRTLQTVWVQYGNTLLPQEQTAGVADGLDEGDDSTYSFIGVRIPSSKIESNALYSYQCMGVNSQAQMLSGGVASFNSR